MPSGRDSLFFFCKGVCLLLLLSLSQKRMKPVFYAEDRSRRTGLLWSYAKEPTGPPVSKDRPEEPAGPSAGSFGPVPPRKTGERINSSFFFLSLPSLFLWRKAYESPAEEALPSVPYIERERYEVTKSRSTLSM